MKKKMLIIISLIFTFLLLFTVVSFGSSYKNLSDADSVNCGTVRLSGKAYYDDLMFTSASLQVSLDLDNQGLYMTSSLHPTENDYYIFNDGHSIHAYANGDVTWSRIGPLGEIETGSDFYSLDDVKHVGDYQ